MAERITAQAGGDGLPFEIPGATGGPFRIEMLNEDAGAGVVTTIIHLPAGARIPAHRHAAGAEMHFVLEGDLIDADRVLGPGAFLTHAAGVVHGPHESRGGARVLTVQQWQSKDGSYDFEIVEGAGARGGAGRPAGASPAGDERGAIAAEGVPQVGADAAQQDRQAAEQSLGKGYG